MIFGYPGTQQKSTAIGAYADFIAKALDAVGPGQKVDAGGTSEPLVFEPNG